MAQLRTNYKDEVLDVSVNTQRKYRQVNNADGTVSFVDATDYAQQGDSFGAGDINAITGNLTADNGESFNFGYDSEKKEYGFWAKVEGADTFFPFSNAKKLYEALQYSGIVTEDMTFDEMCEALARRFPNFTAADVIKNGVLNTNYDFYRYESGQSVTATWKQLDREVQFTKTADNKPGYLIYQMPINGSLYSKSKITVSSSNPASGANIYLLNTPQNTSGYKAHVAITGSGDFEINMSNINETVYVCINLPNTSADVRIADLHFE